MMSSSYDPGMPIYRNYYKYSIVEENQLTLMNSRPSERKKVPKKKRRVGNRMTRDQSTASIDT